MTLRTPLLSLAGCGLALSLACGGGGGDTSSPAPAGPVITTPPSAQAGYSGDRVTFQVVAQGTGLAYQWLGNGVPISGATSASYTFTVGSDFDQYQYSVKVTNASGVSTTSPGALLDVLYAEPAVVAGHDHALALTTKGKVYAWGVGANGQLGLGDWQARSTPTLVNLPRPAVQVAAGYGHSLAVLNDGTLYAWGVNTRGQLGDGTTTPRNTPAPVPGMTGVDFVAAGYNHNLATKADQSVWVWGFNALGQLGQGDKVDRLSPVPIPASASQLLEVALGELHTLVVDTANHLYGCGDNGYGQLGLPYSPTAEYLTFTPLRANVKSVRTFSLYSTILGTDGLPYGTGENAYGALGDGTLTTRYGWVPISTAGLPGAVAEVVPGQYHTLLRGASGTASVGYNWYGQLGIGTATASPYTASQAVAGLQTLQASASYASSYALMPDLTVRAWGYNNNGRLGDGTSTDRPAPTVVPGLFLGPLPTGVAPPAVGRNARSLRSR